MLVNRNILPYLSGICMAAIFGFSFLFTKEALNNITPFHLLAFRFGVSVLVLSMLKMVKVIRVDFSGKDLKPLMAIAFVQPVSYFVFETIGIYLASSSEAGMVIALIPVAVTILAAVFLKEHPSPLQTVCVILSVAGVIYILICKSTTAAQKNLIGISALLFAVLSASVFNILARKFSRHFKPLEITFFMSWAGAVVFNVIAVSQHLLRGEIAHYFTPLFDTKVLIPVMYLGILSSTGAFFLMNYTLSRLEAYRSSVFANLASVISILAGVMIKHEPFYLYHLIGSALIIMGVWGTNYFGTRSGIKTYKSKHTYITEK